MRIAQGREQKKHRDSGFRLHGRIGKSNFLIEEGRSARQAKEEGKENTKERIRMEEISLS